MNGELCNHLVYDGCCKLADVDVIEKVTFKEALDALINHKCGDKKKAGYKYAFQVILNYSHFNWNDSIENFTYEHVEKLIPLLEQRYSIHTVSGLLSSIYASSNIKFRTFYKSIGKKCPNFERFPYKPKQMKTKPELTWEQKTSIDYEIERLRQRALDEHVCNRFRH